MPHVPDDPVLRRLEHPVESDGQLHDPEAGSKMAAVGGAGRDDLLPELGGQKRKLAGRELLQVRRGVYSRQEVGHHDFLDTMYLAISRNGSAFPSKSTREARASSTSSAASFFDSARPTT